jgi:monoamine oxidase
VGGRNWTVRRGTALEVEVNTSRGALLHDPAANDGRPIELRQAINNARGKISELLGKAINCGALDEQRSTHDKPNGTLDTGRDGNPTSTLSGGLRPLAGTFTEAGLFRCGRKFAA